MPFVVRGGRAVVGFWALSRALPWVLTWRGGPWHAGGGLAIWESACNGVGVLTWALLRLSSSLFAFRTSSPRSWAFGPVDAVFGVFHC